MKINSIGSFATAFPFSADRIAVPLLGVGAAWMYGTLLGKTRQQNIINSLFAGTVTYAASSFTGFMVRGLVGSFVGLFGNAASAIPIGIIKNIKGSDIAQEIQDGLKDPHFQDTLKTTVKEGWDLVKELNLTGLNTMFVMGMQTAVRWVPVFTLIAGPVLALPYAVKYCYQVLEERLTRPKLAMEVKYRNWVNWTADIAYQTMSGLFRSLYPATVATLITKPVLLNLSLVASSYKTVQKSSHFFLQAVLSEETLKSVTERSQKLGSFVHGYMPNVIGNSIGQMTGFLQGLGSEVFCKISQEDEPPLKTVKDIVLPNIGKYSNYKPSPRSASHFKCSGECPNLATADKIAWCVGFGVFALALAKTVYSSYQKWKEEPQPIFYPELDKQIKEISKSISNIHKNKGYFQNVLLYGPGGTGKTMVAKMMARDSSLNYVMMSGGDLPQYIKKGTHVTELNKLLLNAKSLATPTVLFIDEAESLVGDRKDMKTSEHVELLNAFLNHTGEQSKKIMIVLATNRLEVIDEAVLSRMDYKLFVGPPAQLEREKILLQYLPKFFTYAERQYLFTPKKIEEIAAKTEGMTGRDLFKLLNKIATSKATTSNNFLTENLVDEVVESAIEQEHLAKSMKENPGQHPARKVIAKDKTPVLEEPVAPKQKDIESLVEIMPSVEQPQEKVVIAADAKPQQETPVLNTAQTAAVSTGVAASAAFFWKPFMENAQRYSLEALSQLKVQGNYALGQVVTYGNYAIEQASFYLQSAIDGFLFYYRRFVEYVKHFEWS